MPAEERKVAERGGAARVYLAAGHVCVSCLPQNCQYQINIGSGGLFSMRCYLTEL